MLSTFFMFKIILLIIVYSRSDYNNIYFFKKIFLSFYESINKLIIQIAILKIKHAFNM